MKKPIDQKTEVLFSLLQAPQTTIGIVSMGVCNPTAVITALRQSGVEILCESIPHQNKFGRKMSFGKFRVANKTKAKTIYNKLISAK